MMSDLELRSKTNLLPISIYISTVSGAEYRGEGGVFYLGLATDSFISQSNLCAYKTEVRVGQELLGIKQPGYTGQCMCMCVHACVCVNKTPPPWIKLRCE